MKNEAREKTVEELLSLLELEDVDPVDYFEDKLARQIGLLRHPTLGDLDWIEVRVRAIDAEG